MFQLIPVVHLPHVAPTSIIAQIFRRVYKAEDCNGRQHRQRLEDVEYPLVGEWVAVNSKRKLDNPVYRTNLRPSVLCLFIGGTADLDVPGSTHSTPKSRTRQPSILSVHLL